MKRAVGGNMGIYGNTKDEVIHQGWPARRLTGGVPA